MVCRVSLVMLLIVSVAVCAHAGDSGFYLGGSIGQSFAEESFEGIDGDDFTIDDGDFAWKLFTGYQFWFLGVEADYRDLGKVNDSNAVADFSTQTTGFDVFGMAVIPIGPVDIFGKLGAFIWESEQKVASLKYSKDGTDLAWGLGLAVHIGPVAVRAEFEKFEVDSPQVLSMASLGISYEF